jgi:uracil-DNA glycosylase
MKVLAVLQNQWFQDPARVREILARRPDLRRPFCHRALFAGCRSGQVLKQVFGPRCRDIIWENASPEIGDHASSKFPADIPHLRAMLEEVKPDVVLALGRVASEALLPIVPRAKLLIGPHPTARGADTITRLKAMAAELAALETNEGRRATGTGE